ncbi:MAG: TetR/AcrR family transcriptional regulator [Pseudomonadota bacterium]|nr:TetR/AcrR family transcriptional regulator [Pseudomonadota bacterium]
MPKTRQKPAASPGRPPDPDKDTAILDAAAALLFQVGPQGVTMEAVAARAGVSKATVYSRHANRAELIRAVVRRHGEAIVGHFAVAPGSVTHLRESLGDFARELLVFLSSDEHTQLVRAVGAARSLASDSVREIFDNGPALTLAQLAQWLAGAAAAGLLQCPQPSRSAELLMGMLSGIDLARALFGLPCARRGAAIAEHADYVVAAFLRLHGVVPLEGDEHDGR